MERKFYTVLFPVLLSVLSQVSGSDTYRAAVVEYHPITGPDQEAVVMKNVANYKKLIEQASKKGADIVVFPEGGLGGKVISPIPDPADNVVPCNGTFQTTQAVKDLSCAARRFGIYVVVNLGEKRKVEDSDTPSPERDYYIYNTNVVFDFRGAVVARYAKYNLFTTDIADQPKEPELVFFDTSFGVRFGTFICFDILFPSPAQRLVQQYNVQNFVYTTYWYSELPFLTALQAQRGWAETNNVNLLASGTDFIRTGSTGSGIYNGKFGHIVEIFAQADTTKLLIADVPKNPQNACANDCRREIIPFPLIRSESSEAAADQELALLKDVLDPYGSEVLKDGEEFEKTVCSPQNFCCDFKIKIHALKPEWKNFTYRAVAFSGVRNFGVKFRGGAQVCAVVVCNGPDIRNCTNRVKEIPDLVKFNEIKIKGNFKLRNSFQMPTTLTDGKDLMPLPANKYSFVREEKEGVAAVSLELLWPATDLHTFGVWGRDFTRDNEPIESCATTVVSVPLILTSIIGFVLFVR